MNMKNDFYIDPTLLFSYFSLNELNEIYNISGVKNFTNKKFKKYNIDVIKNFKLNFSQFKILMKYYMEKSSFPVCEICNKKHCNFERNELKKYCQNYSNCCSISTKEKIKQINLEKYGVENPFQSEIIKEKIKQINLEKYGANWVVESKHFKLKYKENSLIKYGVESPNSSDIVKCNKISSSLKKYGVENPMQNSSVIEKCEVSCKRYKEFIFPSGRIEKVQGYEPQCLLYLLNIEKIKEDDIVLKKCEKPKIRYLFKNKIKFYFPDIYIQSQNRIIEVKSTWTYKKDLEKNSSKKEACIEQGYKFNFYIMEENGTLLEII